MTIFSKFIRTSMKLFLSLPRCVASDLGLHFLPMSHKKSARLIWVYSFMPNAFSHHYQLHESISYFRVAV